MNRSKKLLTLLAVLVVLIGATFAATKLNPENRETGTEEDTGISVYTLDAESLTNISWTLEAEMISLDYSDGVWSYSSDNTFPLDSTYAENMVAVLTDLTASKTIEAPEGEDQYGLENPDCKVLVTLDDGTYTQLLIGDETSMGGEYYLSSGDGNVYLVDSSLLDAFSYGLYDMVKMESIPSMTDITTFEVNSDTQSYRITYQEDSGLAYSNQYTWFMEAGDGYLKLDNELTEALTETVSALEWSQCVDHSADDTDLVSYGLDEPTATVTVSYIETVSVATGEKDDSGNLIYETREDPATFVLELGDYADDSCYARIAGSNMVYLIDASICDTLLYTTYADLQPDEVAIVEAVNALVLE